MIVVLDTVRALQQLAHHIRRATGVRVVAITGSVGKTSTKEITADVLATRYQVVRSPGNLNNHIGLPLSLIALRHAPDLAVVELGMNRPGEISTLVAIAEPEVRVWTNVADVHSAFFDSVEQIADAKAEILEGATADSVLVANANDSRVMARAQHFHGRVTTFGVDITADVVAEDVRDLGLDGVRTALRTPIGSADLLVSLIGRGQLANVLAATAVALQFQIPLSEIVAQAAALHPQPHRGEVIRLTNGVTLVDDSYNSNPPALIGMLDALATHPHHGRRLAVVGEMLELGQRSRALHRRCGQVAAERGIEVLVTVGSDIVHEFADGAIAGGMPATSVHHVSTADQAAELVRTLLRPEDLVLVKGSRGSRTDVVVERLKVELA